MQGGIVYHEVGAARTFKLSLLFLTFYYILLCTQIFMYLATEL